MGLEYYLANHSNATYYELGKGSWSGIADHSVQLIDTTLNPPFIDLGIYDDDARHEMINKIFSDSDSEGYNKLISDDIGKFVKDAPLNSLKLHNDAGDDHWQMKALKYKCAGSRYGLNAVDKNKEYIDLENETAMRTVYDFDSLSQRDRDDLARRGWNFDNVIKPVNKFEFINGGVA